MIKNMMKRSLVKKIRRLGWGVDPKFHTKEQLIAMLKRAEGE